MSFQTELYSVQSLISRSRNDFVFALYQLRVLNTENIQSGNGRFLAYSIMMEKLAQASEGGIVTITYKVAVYAPAEWSNTFTLFHFYCYMISVVLNQLYFYS
jgi:hypothetical protein